VTTRRVHFATSADPASSSPSSDSAHKATDALRKSLAALDPGATVDAYLLLDTPPSPTPLWQLDDAGRAAVIDQRAKAVQPLVDKIDAIVADAGGVMLTHKIDALGALPARLTPKAVETLELVDGIRAILDDRPISPADPSA
jgi:hypothetical protein